MTTTEMMLKLNSGFDMPALGLGVYRSEPGETVAAVRTALQVGYRLIDTAAAYFNERQVGQGIAESGIGRADLFVTTKVWVSDYGYDRALRACDVSLRKLGLDYIDLYLLHWPLPSHLGQTIESYRALETLLADGKVRSIGVCNHTPRHLDDLLNRTGIVPAVNQIELNPYFTQQETRAADRRHGIVTQAWSPIGGVNVYAAKGEVAPRNPLENETVIELTAKYGKTPAQIILRWHMEHGISAIPKSVKPHRIAENIDIFDFSLSPEEILAIDGLDTGVRGGPDPDVLETRRFDMKIED